MFQRGISLRIPYIKRSLAVYLYTPPHLFLVKYLFTEKNANLYVYHQVKYLMCVTALTEEGDSVVNIVNFTRFLDLSLGVQIPIIIIVRVTYLSLPHCSYPDTKEGLLH